MIPPMMIQIVVNMVIRRHTAVVISGSGSGSVDIAESCVNLVVIKVITDRQ